MRRDNTLFKTLTIITGVAGGIIGIISGFVLKGPSMVQIARKLAGSSETLQDSFNLTAMLSVWLSAAFIAVLFWAIHCHLENQTSIIYYLKNLDKNLTIGVNNQDELNKIIETK